MVPKTYSDQRFQVLAVFLNANFHGLASQEFIVDSIPALASSFGRLKYIYIIHFVQFSLVVCTHGLTRQADPWLQISGGFLKVLETFGNVGSMSYFEEPPMPRGFPKKCLCNNSQPQVSVQGKKGARQTISGLEIGLDAFLKLMQKFNIKDTYVPFPCS